MIPRSPAVPELDRPAIEALIAAADAGNPREWVDLCRQAMAHDALLGGAARARAHAAVAAFAPSGPQLHRAIVDRIEHLSPALYLVAVDAPAMGYALVEMGYRRASLRVEGQHRELMAIERLWPVNPSRVRFAHDTDEALLDFPDGAKPLPADKFLVALGTGDGIAVKRGYMRRAIFPVIERQQLLAKVTARVMEGGAETDKESKRFQELHAEIVAIVMDGREHDAGLLGGAVQQLVRAVLRVNDAASTGCEATP